jgi:peptide chain release factor subunit 1
MGVEHFQFLILRYFLEYYRSNDEIYWFSYVYSIDEYLSISSFILFFFFTGGENGFSQAIELSAETLSNVKFVQEKRLLSSFFDQISQDTGKFCFGIRDTLTCLEMGAVETLIVWENLEVTRYVLNNPATGDQEIKFLTKEEDTDGAHLLDKSTGVVLDIVEKQQLLEWIANDYKKFGCALEFVTNRSQEGNQFCRGFGGIGGVLRYQVNTAEFEEDDYNGFEGSSDGDKDNDGYFSSDSDF